MPPEWNQDTGGKRRGPEAKERPNSPVLQKRRRIATRTTKECPPRRSGTATSRGWKVPRAKPANSTGQAQFLLGSEGKRCKSVEAAKAGSERKDTHEMKELTPDSEERGQGPMDFPQDGRKRGDTIGEAEAQAKTREKRGKVGSQERAGLKTPEEEEEIKRRHTFYFYRSR